MKSLKYSGSIMTLIMVLFSFSLSNCSVGVSGSPRASYRSAAPNKRMPPGHAKKAAGQKSARNFAPGHN